MIVLSIVFIVFMYSLCDSIIATPDYGDYCNSSYVYYPYLDKTNCTNVIPSSEEYNNCSSIGGSVHYEYDEEGCSVSFYCDTCSVKYYEDLESSDFFKFLFLAITSLLTIFVSIYYVNKKKINQVVITGFLIGGVVLLAINTIQYFNSLDNLVRTILLFSEIIVLILIIAKLNKTKK